MAKTFSISRLTVQPTPTGESFLWDVPEQASQTFLEGALVMWDAANSGIKEAVSNASVDLAGVAEMAGQNLAANAITRIAPIRNGVCLVEGNLATAAGNTVLALTHIGATAGFSKRSTGTAHWVIDAGGAQKHGRIVGIAGSTIGSPDGLQGAIGDTNARVLLAPFAADIASIKQITW